MFSKTTVRRVATVLSFRVKARSLETTCFLRKWSSSGVGLISGSTTGGAGSMRSMSGGGGVRSRSARVHQEYSSFCRRSLVCLNSANRASSSRRPGTGWYGCSFFRGRDRLFPMWSNRWGSESSIRSSRPVASFLAQMMREGAALGTTNVQSAHWHNRSWLRK